MYYGQELAEGTSVMEAEDPAIPWRLLWPIGRTFADRALMLYTVVDATTAAISNRLNVFQWASRIRGCSSISFGQALITILCVAKYPIYFIMLCVDSALDCSSE